MKLVCRPGWLIVVTVESPFIHSSLDISDMHNFAPLCWCKVMESGSQGVNKGDLIFIPRNTEPLILAEGKKTGLVHDSQVRVVIAADDAGETKEQMETPEEYLRRIAEAKVRAEAEASGKPRVMVPRGVALDSMR